MCYCICAFSEILGTYDTPTIYNEIEKLNFPAPKIYEYISENSYFGERGGDAYNYIVKVFQEWFYGDEKYREKYGDMPSVPGKKCINGDEIPLFDLDKTIKLLKTLSASKRLGIATGRITDEAVVPLKKWGIYDCFCENNISTYSDILKAEQQSGVKNLTKPHEFSFLSAALGKDASTDNLLNGKFDKTVLKRVLAVGDAAADLFSAQNAGIDFAAVLSGIEGKNAKSFFEKNGANFIINDIFDLTEE